LAVRCADAPVGIEGGRPLGKSSEEGCLGRCEVGGGAPEVGAARRLGAHELVAVGGDVQVERENLSLGEPVLEA
jgi:hypothetical protein